MLQYLENYGPFVDFASGRKQIIYTKDINASNVDMYFMSVLNILRDGIDTDLVAHNFITYIFPDGQDVELSIPDSYVNIIMWKLIVMTGDYIRQEHIVFDEDFTAGAIAKYINKYLIIPFRRKMPNHQIYNMIDNFLYLYKSIDEFSMYLSNTANLKDYIDLMNLNPEVYDILHADLSVYPLEEVKKVSDKMNDRLIDIIKNSNHCFRDSFRAKEAINRKQHREYAVAGGTKPNGTGGTFSRIINSNYIIGGLSNMTEHYIEENSGRTAQILSRNNVSDSGHFARLLGLNNQDTRLHDDPNFDCGTRNYIKLTITSKAMLNKYISRYYRMSPNGMESMIDGTESHLVGTTIYVRSPITCKSNTEGHGICYKCYGDVAYTNADINIGKIAAELLSSELTQRLLSAKHLLESVIRLLKWSMAFGNYFVLDGNLISVRDDLENYKDKFILIDSEIHIENEYDDFEFNESICEFKVVDENGYTSAIYTEDADDIFFTSEFSKLVEKYANTDGVATIPFTELTDINLFMIQIHNNGLAETLKKIKDLIDKSKVTSKYDKDSLVQACMETVIEGELNVDAIHCEIIISNQVRLGDSYEERLELPDWSIPNNTNYKIFTLSKALNNHPSITIALSFERIKRALYSPLTYKKTKPSYMDLFFMPEPYEILGPGEYSNEPVYNKDLIIPATIKNRDKQ